MFDGFEDCPALICKIVIAVRALILLKYYAATSSLVCSVVDPIPNTLNLDPDPEFWPNMDTDPDPGLPVGTYTTRYQF